MARCTGSNQFTCEANTTSPSFQQWGSGGTSPARIAIIVGSIIGGILLLAAGTFVWNKVRGKDNVGRSLDELSDNKPTTSSGPKPIDPPGGPGGAAGYGGATAVGAAGAGAAAAGLGRRTPGDPGLNGDLGNLPVSGEYRSGNAYSGGGQPGSYGYPDGRSISPTAGSLTPSMSASVVRGDPVNRFDNAPPMPGSSSYAQSYGSQPYPAQQAPYSTATPSNNGPYYSQAYPQQPPSAVAGNGYVQQQPYANSGGYGSNVSYGNPAFNDAPPAGPPFSGYGQQPAQSGYYPKTQPPQGSGYPTQQPYAPGPQQQYGGPPAGQYQQPRQRY
ncbi:hypothetical protein BC829DRAFT_380096 [Chytridium lagenaria]|nr:hypothetical protein BC829DRAFT_380096 [Chytridium lagenaria]